MKVYVPVLVVALLVGGVFLSQLVPKQTPAQGVEANNELQVKQYAAASLSGDAQVKGVDLATTSVSITYPVHARLMGIFPTNIEAKSVVKSDGKVSVSYPWYGIFYATDQAEIRSKLEAVGRVVGAFSSSTLTVNQQLTLLTLMHAALQSSFAAVGGVQ